MSRDFDDVMKDFANLFQANTFLNTFAKQQGSKGLPADRKSFYEQARNYIKSFSDPKKNNELISSLMGHVWHYQLMEEYVTQISTGNFDPKQAGQLRHRIMENYNAMISGERTFSKQLDTFLKSAKGISLGDDGLRMLKSMVATVENIKESNQTELDLIGGYSDWKKEKEVTDTFEKELNANVDKYSSECLQYKVNYIHPDTTLHSATETLEELKEELDDISTEESQTYHDKAYNDCSDRIRAYQASFEELSKKEVELLDRQTELMNAENRFSIMSDEITRQNRQIKEYELQSKDIEIEINEIDPQIANEDEVRNRYNSAKEVIDNISPEDADRFNIANTYERQNKILKGSFGGAKAFFNPNSRINNGPEDISDAIRLGENAGTLSVRQRNTIKFYNSVKENLLNGAPELKEDIENFEKNPNNKIPLDFEKVLGGKIQSILDTRDTFIKNTPGREQYSKALTDFANCKVELDNIEALKFRKEELSQELGKVKEDMADVKAVSENWKKSAREVLGKNCPPEEKLTIGNASIIAKQLRINCDKQIANNQKKAWELGKKIAGERNTLKQLKSELYPIKSAQLKNKILAQQELVKKATVLADDRKYLIRNVVDVNTRRLESQQTANQILSNPYNKIGERLKNIYDDFDKVQSFWSRGKSPTCQKMYDDLNKAVQALTNPESKPELIKSVLSDLQSSNKQYLDEKNAQNRPKAFASEQRFWRLSLCEEIDGIVGNSLNMVNRLEKDPQVKELRQCANMKQFELAKQERHAELLLNEYTKKSTENIIAKKDAPVQNVQKGKVQEFEDINKISEFYQQDLSM